MALVKSTLLFVALLLLASAGTSALLQPTSRTLTPVSPSNQSRILPPTSGPSWATTPLNPASSLRTSSQRMSCLSSPQLRRWSSS